MITLVKFVGRAVACDETDIVFSVYRISKFDGIRIV